MVKYRQIFFILLFAGAVLTAKAGNMDFPTNILAPESPEETMTLKVTINNATEIKMEKVPTTGFLEVYSILGVKVKSINLKTCEENSCSMDLGKGIYILKIGKTTKKIIVK